MFIISKEFHFSASHILDGLNEDHPCGRMHGHNYVVIVEIKSDKLNEDGFVKDYRELDPIKKWIDETLDHRHLNDVGITEHDPVTFDMYTRPMFMLNPSAEIMARELFYVFQELVPDVIISAVVVKETPKTAARYER